MSGPPTQQQIAVFQQVFDALFDLLRWTYGVRVSHQDRSAIQNQVLMGWAHPDATVPALLAYLGGMHTTVFSQPTARRDQYRPDVQRIFATLFATPDPTARGQVIALLHRMLEQSRPGCTGVAPPARPQIPRSHQPLPAPGPTLGPPPWSPPSAPTASMYGTTPAPVPFAGMTPTAHPGFVPGGGGSSMTDLPDVERLTREAQIRQQKLLLENNLWKMQHDSVMDVIRSMR